MSKMRRNLGALGIAAFVLAGCATNEPAPVIDMSLPSSAPASPAATPEQTPGTYRVVSGDTLYAIAFKHGLDYRDIAAWNGIASPYRIFVGQELRLSAPMRAQTVAPAAPLAVAAKPHAPLSEPAPGAAVTAGLAEHSTTTPTASAFEDVPSQPAAPPPAPVAASGAASKPVETPTPVKPTAEPAKAAPATTVVEATMPKPLAPPKPPVVETPHADSAPELSAGGVTWRWPSDGKVVGTYVSGEPTKQGIDIVGKSGDPVRAAADGEVVYSGNGLIGYGELIIVKHNANFLSAYGHNRSRLVKEGDKVKAGQTIAEMGASASSRDELHFEIRKNGKPVNPLEYLPAR